LDGICEQHLNAKHSSSALWKLQPSAKNATSLSFPALLTYEDSERLLKERRMQTLFRVWVKMSNSLSGRF